MDTDISLKCTECVSFTAPNKINVSLAQCISQLAINYTIVP